MNIFEMIKSDKKLSMSHWRYRVLHWAFGINPKKPDDSPLPDCFYTHYCPLFHLTNLIVLLFPVVLAVKIGGFVINMLFCMIELIRDFLRSERTHDAVEDVGTLRAKQLKQILVLMVDFLEEDTTRTLDDFKFYYGPEGRRRVRLDALTIEEITEVWERYVSPITEALEKKKLAKQRRQERMIFWVGFSRVLFKGVLNLAYLGLGLCSLYLLYQFGPAFLLLVWSGLYGVATFDWVAGLWALAYVTLNVCIVLAGIAVVTAIAIRYQWINIIFTPTLILGSVCEAFFQWIGNRISDVISFVEMFYEDNCPAVTIVSDDEAVVSAAVEEEV